MHTPCSDDGAVHEHETSYSGESAPFHLPSHWHIKHPPMRVWDVFSDIEHWDQWWPGLQNSDVVHDGDTDGEGTHAVLTVHRPLCADLKLHLAVTASSPPGSARVEVSGDLRGHGHWKAATDSDGSARITIVWCVVTSKRLLRVARPFGRWAHSRVMDAGGKALSTHLDSQTD